MKSIVPLAAGILLWHVAALPAAETELSVSLPPELAALNELFLKAQAEQLTAPFDAEVAKLNASYLAELDRAIASTEAGIAALGGTKKAIEAGARTKGSPITYVLEVLIDEKRLMAAHCPSNVGRGDMPETLAALRKIYTDAYTKLESGRYQKLAALAERLGPPLNQLEADLARSRRDREAALVRDYRTILNKSLVPDRLERSSLPAMQRYPSTLNPALSLTLKEGFTNSLGMKFVPVPGTHVLFCIHETRMRDYAAFAAEVPYVRTSNTQKTAEQYLNSFNDPAAVKKIGWESQSVDGDILPERRMDHPVTRLRWDQMQAFCAWLSRKEDRRYRLPTDREWSFAVGLGEKEKWEKGMYHFEIVKNQEAFPWGNFWPPTSAVGNYATRISPSDDPNAKGKFLEGYDDGYPTTAPVMSFDPNALGIYDLGGNVSETMEDWADRGKGSRIWRGGNWTHSYRGDLLSSSRATAGNTSSWNAAGFRVVLSLHGDFACELTGK